MVEPVCHPWASPAQILREGTLAGKASGPLASISSSASHLLGSNWSSLLPDRERLKSLKRRDPKEDFLGISQPENLYEVTSLCAVSTQTYSTLPTQQRALDNI